MQQRRSGPVLRRRASWTIPCCRGRIGSVCDPASARPLLCPGQVIHHTSWRVFTVAIQLIRCESAAFPRGARLNFRVSVNDSSDHTDDGGRCHLQLAIRGVRIHDEEPDTVLPVNPVGSENSTGPIPLASQVLHLLVRLAEFAVLRRKPRRQVRPGRCGSRGRRSNPRYCAHFRRLHSHADRNGQPQPARSGRVAVVEVQHAAQALTALDSACGSEVGRVGADDPVAQTLVIALCVRVGYEFGDGFSQ